MYNNDLIFDNVVEFLEIIADKAKNGKNLDNKAIFDALSTILGKKELPIWTSLADFADISRQESEQNYRLKHLAIERSNAKRGIKPKKKESGYIILRYELEKQRYYEGRKRDITTAILQTPYDKQFTIDDIIKFTTEDFSKILDVTGLSTFAEIKCYTFNGRSGFWEIKVIAFDAIF